MISAYYVIAIVAFVFMVLITVKAIRDTDNKPDNVKPQVMIFIGLLSITIMICLLAGISESIYSALLTIY